MARPAQMISMPASFRFTNTRTVSWRLKLEFSFLAIFLGLAEWQASTQIFKQSYIFKALSFIPRPKFRVPAVLKLSGFTLLLLIAIIPLFQAFEAHVVNVTAQPVFIDPPVMTPPFVPVAWNVTDGGTGLVFPLDVFIVATDPDATHLYYTFGPGLVPTTVPDPVCGGAFGGIKSGVYSVNISGDSVIKAIACDGSTGSAHHSVINIKIYDPPAPAAPEVGPNTEQLILPNDQSGDVSGETINNPDPGILTDPPPAPTSGSAGVGAPTESVGADDPLPPPPLPDPATDPTSNNPLIP